MERLDIAEASRVARQCVCFNLRKANRLITQIYDQALQPCGLRATQFDLLIAIQTYGPITIKRLAEKLLMHRTALARNLKPLEKKGFIKIEPGHDRRERRVRMTEAGQKALVEAYPYWDAAQRQVADALGQEQLNQILSGIVEISAVLEA
jgi:DNA-binding MarR family transcriptional regulator